MGSSAALKMRRSPVQTWFSALPGSGSLAPGVIGYTPGFEPGNSRFEPWGANSSIGQQLKGRASLSKSEGCGFKSYLACLIYPRSSMDEQPPSKRQDTGSMPAGGAMSRWKSFPDTLLFSNAPVAQLDRARLCEGRGPRIVPWRGHYMADVAQWKSTWLWPRGLWVRDPPFALQQ